MEYISYGLLRKLYRVIYGRNKDISFDELLYVHFTDLAKKDLEALMYNAIYIHHDIERIRRNDASITYKVNYESYSKYMYDTIRLSTIGENVIYQTVESVYNSINDRAERLKNNFLKQISPYPETVKRNKLIEWHESSLKYAKQNDSFHITALDGIGLPGKEDFLFGLICSERTGGFLAIPDDVRVDSHLAEVPQSLFTNTLDFYIENWVKVDVLKNIIDEKILEEVYSDVEKQLTPLQEDSISINGLPHWVHECYLDGNYLEIREQRKAKRYKIISHSQQDISIYEWVGHAQTAAYLYTRNGINILIPHVIVDFIKENQFAESQLENILLC